MLYRLAWLLNGNNKSQAFIASCLHVFAPGGLFLSAPYAESLFSLLNFSGMLVYCEARRAGIAKGRQRDLFLILSGLIFGAAATVRSNAIFSGILFAYEALVCLPKLPQLLTSVSGLRYVFSLVLGGSLAGLGFALPQYIAYLEYCTDSIPAAQRRTWCDAFPPSIYTFVQGHYWLVKMYQKLCQMLTMFEKERGLSSILDGLKLASFRAGHTYACNHVLFRRLRVQIRQAISNRVRREDITGGAATAQRSADWGVLGTFCLAADTAYNPCIHHVPRADH